MQSPLTSSAGPGHFTSMVGCFGLNEPPCQVRIPLRQLVESRARLDATVLNKTGALVDGTVTELRWGEIPYQLARRTPNLLINGSPVLVVWTDHALPWFECPRCGRRCRHIFLDELACRICLRLDYASRHLHRQTPGIHRVARLRRQIGADPRPFSPLPDRPKHHVHFHRVADQIRAEEASLVNYLGTIVQDLRRRIRVRKAKHQW